MINLEPVSIMAPMTGYVHTLIRRSLDAGKETPESIKAEQERVLEDTKRVQTISPTYNSRGQIIDTRDWKGLPLICNSEGEIADLRYKKIDISG